MYLEIEQLPIPEELSHSFMSAHLIPTRASWTGNSMIVSGGNFMDEQ